MLVLCMTYLSMFVLDFSKIVREDRWLNFGLLRKILIMSERGEMGHFWAQN